ncbi:ketopantoate reductase family protein [Homoserinimonas sp. A520]
MDVAVIGAGAIGGTIAALLDRSGHSVEITARGKHLHAIRTRGLRLSGAWGEHTAKPAAGETLRTRPGLAVLSTKAMDAPAAATANHAMLAGVPVVVVQNGLGGLESVTTTLTESPIIGALSLIAASLTAPGEIEVTTAASTWLGMLDTGVDDEPARFAADILNQAIPCEVVTNFEGARWTKLIINQVNALPAVTGLSVQDVINHAGLRRLMTESMREAVGIALARGVHFEEVNRVSHDSLLRLVRADAAEAEFLTLQLRDYLGDVPNPGSTLQSIRRSQPSEIDYLNGAVVQAAAERGLDAPVNARLTELVHEVEATGRHLTPEETLTRF